MTAEGWKRAVLQAADRHSRGDDSSLDLLICLLVEIDGVKARLVTAGWSWTGRPIGDTIDEMLQETESLRSAQEIHT